MQDLYDQGKTQVNGAGEWRRGLPEPLWVMTNLKLEGALEVYRARMRGEESFKDLKTC